MTRSYFRQERKTRSPRPRPGDRGNGRPHQEGPFDIIPIYFTELFSLGRGSCLQSLRLLQILGFVPFGFMPPFAPGLKADEWCDRLFVFAGAAGGPAFQHPLKAVAAG